MGARQDKIYPLIYRLVTGEDLPENQKNTSDKLPVASVSQSSNGTTSHKDPSTLHHEGAGLIKATLRMTDAPKSSPKNPKDQLVLQLFPFKDNELGINHRQGMLKNFHKIKEQINFHIIGNSATIRMYVTMPASLRTYFENIFYAAYPTSDLIVVEDGLPPQGTDEKFVHFGSDAEIATKEYYVQDGTYIDPMKDTMSLFAAVPATMSLSLNYSHRFQIRVSKRQAFLKKAKKIASRIIPQKPEEKKPDEVQSEEEKKVRQYEQSKGELYLSISYSMHAADEYTQAAIQDSLSKSWKTFVPTGSLSFKTKKPSYQGMSRSQACNFFHIPTKANPIKQLEYAVYRKLPFPAHVPTLDNTDRTEITVLGKTDFKGQTMPFGIRREDKFRHMYIIGKTGTGKSTFLSNMIRSDMYAGSGLCLIDPHGDLVDTVLEHVPSHRSNDVVLFDVGDQEYPIGFNLLQYSSPDEKIRIVSGVVSVFHKLFGHSRGPRLEYILRNVLLTLVDYPNATILHLMRVLTDKNFREEVLAHLQDKVVLRFRRDEFDKRNDKQQQDAIGPITNKVGQFLSSSIVRNIFGQPNTKLSIREAMDSGKIVLVNLSKGRIGEDNAKMIGSLLVTKIQIDAMSRADIAFQDRRDFYLYIDEFQNFATESFATILSEARKYRLSLIVANQYTSQLDQTIRDAIFGNVGTMISFTLGYDDATVMSSQYKEMISPNDMISLPRFKAYIKLMVDGVMTDPFSMQTLPLVSPEDSVEIKDKIRRQSRQRYAMERGRLEQLLQARANKSFSKQETIARKAKLEGLGLTEDQVAVLDDLEVQRRTGLFRDYAVEGNEPDAILMDVAKGNHRAIRHTLPQDMARVAQSHPVKKKGTTFDIQGHTLRIAVDKYIHTSLRNEANKLLTMRVGSADEVSEQLRHGFGNTTKWKYVINVDKRQQANPAPKKTQTPSSRTSQTSTGAFTVDDITLGEWYDGYVKLIYNYGIFVTVKGVEGLLHKNRITKVPDGVKFADFYNQGDKIRVKASEYKMIKGEKKVVWSQKG